MKKIEIEHISDIKDINPFESIWREITDTNGDDRYYLSYDWFYPLVHLTNRPLENFHIFLIKADAKTVGIIPCLLTTKKKRLFRLKTLQLAGNTYSFERGAAVQKTLSDSAAAAFANYLFNDFSSSWDIIDFRNVSPHDDFQSSLRHHLQKGGAKIFQGAQFTNIVTDLSQYSAFDEFNKLLSKNFKRKIIKSINKMNRSGEFTIQLINENSRELKDSLDNYYKVYSKSWKAQEKDPTFHRRLGEYLHAKGMLRLALLCFRPNKSADCDRKGNTITSINDSIDTDSICPDDAIPIASYFAIQQGKTTYGLKTAYDTDYSNFSPGSVLLYFLTKYLVNHEKSIALNHQKGIQQFKYHIGGKKHAEYLFFYASNKRSFLATAEVLIDNYLLPIYKSCTKKNPPKKSEEAAPS